MVAHDSSESATDKERHMARGFAEAPAILDEVELLILAVPDDVIERLAGELLSGAIKHNLAWTGQNHELHHPAGGRQGLSDVVDVGRHRTGRRGS